jgi:hypothetical protein
MALYPRPEVRGFTACLVKWAEMKREAGQVFPPPFFPMRGSRLT